MQQPILYAPLSYWNATAKQKAEVCNGCGAKGGIKVPNTFYGLCIKEACNIHDWMYKEGRTLADKMFADAMFRTNMSSIIDAKSNSFMAKLRHLRASKYYIAVVEWGDDAYWVNKVFSQEKHITYKGEFR